MLNIVLADKCEKFSSIFLVAVRLVRAVFVTRSTDSIVFFYVLVPLFKYNEIWFVCRPRWGIMFVI